MPAGPGQDVVVVVDLRRDAGVLVDDPLPLEGGEPAQLHVEDGRRLHLVDVEQFHQAAPSGLGGRGRPDERDYGVQLVQRLEQAAQDVDAFLGLAEQVLSAPDDDFDLVLDVIRDELVQPQRARHAVDDREHVRAERRLQLGVLEQVVQHDLGDRVPLEGDHDPHTDAIGRFVVDVGDPRDPALAGQLRDGLDEVVGIDLIGQLGRHQDGAAFDVLLDATARIRWAGRSVPLDPVTADDEAVRGSGPE